MFGLRSRPPKQHVAGPSFFENVGRKDLSPTAPELCLGVWRQLQRKWPGARKPLEKWASSGKKAGSVRLQGRFESFFDREPEEATEQSRPGGRNGVGLGLP